MILSSCLSPPPKPITSPNSLHLQTPNTSFDSNANSTKPTTPCPCPSPLPLANHRTPCAPKPQTKKLRALLASKNLADAVALRADMAAYGVVPDVVLETMLIDLLMKSGRAEYALELFDAMPDRNVVTWTSVIAGCARNGIPELGLSLFAEMLDAGVAANDFACNAALVACAHAGALRLGEQVHSLVVRSGLAGDSWIGNCLIDFYSRCRLMCPARDVFDRMLTLDVVGYTSLISGLCRNGEFEQAVEVFDQMARQGIEPNEHTITSILTACPRLLGKQIHAYIIKSAVSQSVHSASALIDFYTRNEEFESARMAFETIGAKNIVSWCSIISSCIRNGNLEEALQVFGDMVSDGINPNEFAFSITLAACGLFSESIAFGRQLHCLAIKHDSTADIRVSNALLSMYGRSGHVEELQAVFEKIERPDIVSWTAAISAYFRNGFDERSIWLLSQMHSKGFAPNDYAFSSALSSCAVLALLDQGMQFHCLALKLGCNLEICTGNALINMYAKCGRIGDARLAFDVMQARDVTSWNSLIHGYAQHGDANLALEAFNEMDCNTCRPDDSTFLGILAGCNHGGLVHEGEMFFKLMTDRYGIMPSASHYACMIDMLGRNGRIEEALHMIEEMPFDPDILIWKTLLGSCKLHGNLEVGKLAVDKLMELSAKDSASYVLMSNIYAMHGEWEDAERVRRRMDEMGVKKDAGWSWIEIKNKVHAFVARDLSHPSAAAVYDMLGQLLKVMRDEGYSPDMML